MSIYIKGMEIPKGTNMMLLITPDGDVWEMGDLLGNDKLIEGAKAVPVPTPHGRLIDADALVDSFDPSDFWNPDAEDNCFAAIHVVNCAPTIIEEER